MLEVGKMSFARAGTSSQALTQAQALALAHALAQVVCACFCLFFVLSMFPTVYPFNQSLRLTITQTITVQQEQQTQLNTTTPLSRHQPTLLGQSQHHMHQGQCSGRGPRGQYAAGADGKPTAGERENTRAVSTGARTARPGSRPPGPAGARGLYASGATSTLILAVTSRCSRSSTSYLPSALMGSGRWMLRRSTFWPDEASVDMVRAGNL